MCGLTNQQMGLQKERCTSKDHPKGFTMDHSGFRLWKVTQFQELIRTDPRRGSSPKSHTTVFCSPRCGYLKLTRTSHESEVVSSPCFFQCVNPTSPKNTRGELSYLGFVASEAPHWRRPQSFWRPAGPEKMAGLDTKEWAFFEPTKSWLTNINSGFHKQKPENLWCWPGICGLPEDCHSEPFSVSGSNSQCHVQQYIYPWQAMILSEGGYEWENRIYLNSGDLPM
jgi:hypothetical protein